MKKHKSWGKYFLSIIAIFLLMNCLNVKAAELVDCNSDENKEACDVCNSKLSDEFQVKKEKSKDNSTVTFTIVSENNKTPTFSVKVYKNHDTDNPLIDKEYKAGEQIVVSTGYTGSFDVIIDLEAVLVDNYSVTKNKDKYDCKNTYTVEAQYRFGSKAKDAVPNPSVSAGGMCYKYLNGQLTSSDVGTKYAKLLTDYTYANVSANGVGDNNFQNLMSYCFQSTVQQIYPEEWVLERIYKVAEVVIATSNATKFSETLPNHVNDGFVKLDPNKKIDLTCDAFLDNVKKNVRNFYAETEAYQGKATFHYNPGTETNVDVCSVKCVEEVTVTYGPPVAVKAGMCFEYEVQIQSKVTCSAQLNGGEGGGNSSAPKLEDYGLCEPAVYCDNNQVGFSGQAGPNDQFDSCITSCDGGKYSQSCINKCYNKVYGKNKKTKLKLSLPLSEDAILKMAFSGNQAWCNQTKANANEGANVYDGYRKTSYFGGYYTSDANNNIVWHSYNKDSSSPTLDGKTIPTIKGCHWNDYSRFYFLSYNSTLRTVGNGQVYGSAWDYCPTNDNTCRSDNLNKWSYTANDVGVKLGYNHYANSNCNDKCEYEVDTCEGYLNDVAPDGLSGKYQSRYENYLKDLEAYKDAIAGCEAKATCNTDTATYKMTVNNSTGEIKTCKLGEDSKTCESWTETNDKKTKVTRDSKDNIITKEVSGVCANGSDNKTDDYKTVLSFPGSYVNNKTGSVEFGVSKEDEDFYTYKNGQYCVPLNAKEVNKSWWIWDQVYQRDEAKKSTIDVTKKKDSTNTEYNHYNGIYNILADIGDFGYLNWDVGIECFYAVGQDNSCPSGDCPTDCVGGNCGPTVDECKGEDCDKNIITNFDTKAAALDQLFPPKADTKTTGTSSTKEIEKDTKLTKLNYASKKSSATKMANSSVTGRSVGYNWSCDATNLKIQGYPVTPTALITKIQSQGEKVYSDKTEVDFHISLTKTNIKNIRNDFKNKDYSEGLGEDTYYKADNNIKFYKSNFLSNRKYISSYTGPNNHTCNNMKSGTCDTLATYVSAESTCPKLKEGA